LPPEAEEQIKRQALDSLVLNRAVTQYVRDAGFRVSANRVVDYVRSLPVFQVGGQFSKPAYDATLAAQGITPMAYEQEQQALLAVRQLQEGIVESSFFHTHGIPPPHRPRPGAPGRCLRCPGSPGHRGRHHGQRCGRAVLLRRKLEPVSSSPETATIEYVEVSLQDMARDYTPDEEALRKAYEADPTRFRTAEERRARHILITVDANRTDSAARALADEISGRLAKGEDFAALAAQYSGDPGSANRGGDLGFAAPGNYVEAFDKALFALKPGETSAPVKTEFGYHIIRLEELRQGAEKSFEEVRAQLTDELRRQKAQDEFYAIAERLR